MRTARDEEADLLVGVGADADADADTTKPFSMQELVAWLRALLRRANTTAGDQAEAGPITVGDLTVDPATRETRLNGTAIDLIAREFDLLHHLARRPGVVHGLEQLLREVWGYEDGAGERTVDAHIRGLWRKLGPDVIRTARGAGYALRRPER